MGFFDFLKRKKEPEFEAESLEFRELDSWIQAKKENIKDKEKRFSGQIRERLLQLVQEIEQGVKTLREIDIKEKRAPEQAKKIVQSNLENFTERAAELAANFRGLDAQEPNKLTEQINSAFSDFEKKSSASFHKANLLVGKELTDVIANAAKFFKDLKKLEQENKEYIAVSKAISAVQEKLNEVAELEKAKSVFEGKVKSSREKIAELENEKKQVQKKIDEVKGTEEYKDRVRKRGEIENIRKNWGKYISGLRELINFKALASEFHTEPKKMEIVKEYKNDFQKGFEKDNGKRLAELLKMAKLNNEKISEKMKEVLRKKEEISKVVKLGTEELEAEIEKADMRIRNVNAELAKEKKKYEKLASGKDEIKNSIRAELKKINVELS